MEPKRTIHLLFVFAALDETVGDFAVEAYLKENGFEKSTIYYKKSARTDDNNCFLMCVCPLQDKICILFCKEDYNYLDKCTTESLQQMGIFTGIPHERFHFPKLITFEKLKDLVAIL